MTKFNTIHNEKTNSNLCGKIAGPRGFCVLGILMLSLIALAPVVDAGCACSAVGNWEAKAQEFLKSDDTGVQPVSSSSDQTSTVASQPKTVAKVNLSPTARSLSL